MTQQKNLSLADKVYAELEEEILSGKYARGQSLHESALADMLGVSRTPLREAIRRLEQDGLLETIPNKGIFVRGISVDDIIDIYNIRINIEGLAIEKAIDKADDEAISELEEILDLQEFYASKGDYEKSMRMDSRFHGCIYKMCGSPPLTDILCNLHNKIQRFRKTSFSSSSRAKNATDEHRQMLEAIKMRDSERAVALAKRHTENAKENLIKLYKEKELWD